MTVRCLGCMTEYEANSQACPNCGYVPGTQAESLLHLQPGTVLAGRYTVGKVIGFGGFGVTYISWDQTLQQSVAIKEYLPSEFATRAGGQTHVTVFSGNKAEQFAGGMVKFIDEARKLAKFQSEEGIVRVYDSFEANNTAYIVMEYLDGETLTAYLEREGKVPINQAIEMLTPVIHSLEAVHQAGVIHRDIAPDNIMITKDGQVKLIDFGAARYATTSHSRSLTVIIKPGYSPEEQYRSRGDQGPHTDVYSLGAVLYRMVTGITPPDALERRAFFENKKKNILIPPSKNCKLTRNQENAILNAMNIRVEDRTSTAAEFLSQLTAVSRVQRATGKIKAIDLMKWPLWAKITVPACSAAAVTLLVLLFTGTIGFENHLATTLTIGQNMTRVPSVVNCTVEAAQDRLDGAGLPAIISGRETSDTIPANMVLRQSVSAGAIVEKNTRVELYISAAEEPAEENTMPNVSYYTQAKAEEMLKKLGAVVTVEQEYSSDVAAGIVLRSSMPVGKPVAKGDAVTLYVSMGAEPAPEGTGEPDTSETAKIVPSSQPAPPPIPALSLSQSSLSLKVGGSATLGVSGGNGTYSWSSSNPAVANVTSSGVVSALADGSATITVSSGGKSATCMVTTQTVWSDWLDYRPNAPDANIQTKTVYRYRDNIKRTTKSKSDYIIGWTQYDSAKEYGSWSDWSNVAISESSSREIQTQQVKVSDGHTEYRYGRWYNSTGVVNWCAEYSIQNSGGTCTIEYDDWSTQRRSHGQNDVFTCGCTDAEHPRHTHVATHSSDGRAWWIQYAGNWYWEESRWVDATYETQYRSREIYTIYYFYQWEKGSWSSWSESPYYSNGEGRDVESKTQYRYKITT